MPRKRDTAISFADGSENPHGHHEGDAPTQSQLQSTTLSSSPPASDYEELTPRKKNLQDQFDQSLSVVTRLDYSDSSTTGGNGTTKTVPSPMSQKWSDPLSPSSSMRGPRPLPRSNGGKDIRSMWDTPGNTMRDGEDLELSRTISSERERTDKHFPGAGRSKRDEEDERGEEQQLLSSSRNTYDDPYADEREKGRSRPF